MADRAVTEAKRETVLANSVIGSAKRKEKVLSTALENAVIDKMRLQRSAQDQLNAFKTEAASHEAKDVNALKAMAEERIKAILANATKTGQELLAAKREVKRSHAEISKLKAQVVQMQRASARKLDVATTNIEKKERAFWQHQVQNMAHQEQKDVGHMMKKTQHAVSQATKVEREAMHDEQHLEHEMHHGSAKTAQHSHAKQAQQDAKYAKKLRKIDQSEVEGLRAQLHHVQGIASKAQAQLAGKSNANNKLTSLVHKMSQRVAHSDKKALASAARADRLAATLRTERERLRLPANFTDPTKEFDALMKTPCYGEACDQANNEPPRAPAPFKPVFSEAEIGGGPVNVIRL